MTFGSEHCTCCQFFVFNKSSTTHHFHRGFCREIRNVDKGAKKLKHDGGLIDANFLENKFNDISKLLIVFRDKLNFSSYICCCMSTIS